MTIAIPKKKTKTPERKLLLTYDEIAELCSVCPRTVYKWYKQGLLKAVKTSPKCVRFSLKELEKFIERQEGLQDED